MNPGFREWTATATFTLHNSIACEYLFSWQSCCRTKLITTGAAGQPFYIDAFVNTCELKGTGSPQFSSPYYPYLGKGGGCSVKKNTAGRDIGSGDELYSYTLAEPRQSAQAGVSFNSPYSYKEPLTHFGGFGHPEAADSNGCAGYKLDAATGDLHFWPYVAGETFPVAVSLSEIKNGKLVSRVSRDLMYSVIDVPDNRPPVVTGADCAARDVITLRPGDCACFTFCTFDPDIDDTVTLTGFMEMKGAKFTVEEGRKWPKGVFIWTQKKDQRTAPYHLILRAEDNSGLDEFLGRQTAVTEKTILIYVLGQSSINESEPKKTLSVYPQPARSMFIVSLKEPFNTVTLYDMLGRVQPAPFSFMNDELKFDVASMPSGAYSLRIVTDKAVYSARVIIAK